jgi:Putative regulator of cell autolysis
MLQQRGSTFFICILCLFIVSCHTKNREKTADKYTYADSLTEHYKELSLEYPDLVRQKLLKVRQVIKDSINYYKLTQSISYTYFNDNKIDSALILNDRVIHFCTKNISDTTRLNQLKTDTYFHKGLFLSIISNIDSAQYYLNKAYQTAILTKENKKSAEICIRLAYNYSLQGNYTSSVLYYKKAQEAANLLKNNTNLLFFIQTGLAKVYLGLNNYKQSNIYFTLAEEKINEVPPYHKFIFASLRASYYEAIKKYENALKWYKEANIATRKFKFNIYRGITECNVGGTYILLNKPDSARYYLDKANFYFTKSNQNINYSFYLNGLYAELALLKNDLRNAHKLLNKKYDLSQIALQYIHLYNERLELYYEKKGNFQNAYYYRTKVDIYDDSVRRKTLSSAISELNSRYSQDTSKLKHNIALSENKADLQKMRLISILSLSLLIIGAIIICVAIQLNRKKRESRFAKQFSTIAKLRMENIRNRISPHVLFNMLNAVMPTFKQDDNLVHLFRLLAQSLRSNLIASEKMAVSLEEEIEFVKNYIEFRKNINSKK